MTLTRETRLFFDASCLIAAAGSPTGGSSFLLSLCARRYLKGAISQPVLQEAQRNIHHKLGDEALERFYRFLVVVPFVLAPLPSKTQLQKYEKFVSQKDAHVVAAAVDINAQFLITLDQRLVSQVNQSNLHLGALTPGEFIKSILPLHIDFPL